MKRLFGQMVMCGLACVLSVACATKSEPKPEPPVYVEAEETPEPEPQPPVVPVPVTQAVPGQARPVPPSSPSKADIEKARKEAAGREPHEIIDEANQRAAAEPMEDGYFNAMQRYQYSEGALYQVYTAPLKLTAIQFAPGEEVTSVAIGDTVRWTVGRTSTGQGAKAREVVVIKPVRAWLSTTMTITTNHRLYHLELQSYEETYMASVRWDYPQDLIREYERRHAQTNQNKGGAAASAGSSGKGLRLAASPAQLRFSYAFVLENPKRRPDWMPIRVFDDGQKTYIKFPEGVAEGEAPALFVLSDSGEAQIVNFRTKGQFYVVDRTFELAQLRMGEKDPVVVGIERLEDQ